MVADNLHSRIVGLAKIAFPLLALGVLSTIFLFSRTLDPEDAIPFSDVDIAQIVDEQRLTKPKFSGVTSDGSAITVEAETARPDLEDPGRVSAQNITATIETKASDTYAVTADTARFDGSRDTLDLEGNVQITGSGGYLLTSETLTANLETTGLIAEGGVSGTAPGGTLEAGRMELLTRDGGQHLLFTNGVRLVYTPGT